MSIAENRRRREERRLTLCTAIEGFLLSEDFESARRELHTLIEEEKAAFGVCTLAECEWYALLIRYKAKNDDDLVQKDVPFMDSEHYAKALLFAERGDHDEMLSRIKKAATRAGINAEKKVLMAKEKQDTYNRALKAARNADSPGAYGEIISLLEELGDYRDAPARIAEFRATADKLTEYRTAVAELDRAADNTEVESVKTAHPNLRNFRDFDTRIGAAFTRIAARETEEAYTALCRAFDTAADRSAFEELIPKFEAMQGYKASADYIEQCRRSIERIDTAERERLRAEEEARAAAELARLQELAADYDRSVRLLERGIRDREWCAKVRNLPAGITDEIQPYIQTLDVVRDLLQAANETERRLDDEDRRRLLDAAREYEEEVARIRAAARSNRWCDLVERHNAEFSVRPDAFRSAAINAAGMLEEMAREIPLVRAASGVDEAVRQLETKSVNLAWCDEVIRLQGTVTDAMRPYLHEAARLKTIHDKAAESRPELYARWEREQEESRRIAAEEAARRAAEAEERRKEEEERRKKKQRTDGIRDFFWYIGLGILFGLLFSIPAIPFGTLLISNIVQEGDIGYWAILTAIAVVVSIARLLTARIPVVRWICSVLSVAASIVATGMGQHTLVIVVFLFSLLFSIEASVICKTFDVFISTIELVLPAMCAAVSLGCILHASWGVWAMVFIGGMVGLFALLFVLAAWLIADEGEIGAWIGYSALIPMTVTAIVFLFISRDLAYLGLSMLIVNVAALVICGCSMYSKYVPPSSHYGRYDARPSWEIAQSDRVTNALSAFSWSLGSVKAIAIVIAFIWCIGVWGIKPVTVSDNAAHFHLDRSEVEVFTAVAPEDADIVKRIRAPKAHTVVIGEGFTVIGAKSMKTCDTMTTVYIPSDVREIRESAFEDCFSLKTVYIGFNPDGSPSETPSDLAQIGALAFNACPIETIYFNGTRDEWYAIEQNFPENWISIGTKIIVSCNDVNIQY